MKILIIEDQKKVSQFVKKGLDENSIVSDVVNSGEEGLFLAETEAYDVIILDLMLPDLSGTVIIQKLRQSNITTPILALTAKSDIETKVKTLNLGADDYLVKPFSFSELLARVRALSRRQQKVTSNLLKVEDLEMDLITRKVQRQGIEIFLTPKEFALLELLLTHQNHVLTRTIITERVWDYHFDTASNTVDVFINNLRQKIDKPFNNPLIHTVRGVGYVLKPYSTSS